MTRKREGMLTERDWRSLDGDEFGAPGLADLGDFFEQAEALAASMKGRGALSDRRARRLLAGCKHLRAAAARAELEPVLYDAIEAALVFAALRAEDHDDTRPHHSKKLTRAKYFALVHKHPTWTDEQIAAECDDMSVQGLNKWRKANLENMEPKRKPKRK